MADLPNNGLKLQSNNGLGVDKPAPKVIVSKWAHMCSFWGRQSYNSVRADANGIVRYLFQKQNSWHRRAFLIFNFYLKPSLTDK